MQHDCAKQPQSVFETANALEAFLAKRIIDCCTLYVEKRADYGLVVLHGINHPDCCAGGCLVQLNLYTDRSSGHPIYIHIWHILNGIPDEHGAVVFAEKLDLEFWLVLCNVLRIYLAMADADCMAHFLENHLGHADDCRRYRCINQETNIQTGEGINR